jgi:hypothetical protein
MLFLLVPGHSGHTARRVAEVRCSQVAAESRVAKRRSFGSGDPAGMMAGGGGRNPEGAAGEFSAQSRRAQLPARQR